MVILSLKKQEKYLKNINSDIIEKYPKIEWKVIKSLRNKIVHDYEGIDLQIIWDIIQNDIKMRTMRWDVQEGVDVYVLTADEC